MSQINMRSDGMNPDKYQTRDLQGDEGRIESRPVDFQKQDSANVLQLPELRG